MQELLEPHPQVSSWMKRVAARTAPHYDDVSMILRKAARRFKEDRDKQASQSASKL